MSLAADATDFTNLNLLFVVISESGNVATVRRRIRDLRRVKEAIRMTEK